MSRTQDNTGALVILAVFALIVAIPYSLFWNAVTAWQYWQWFLIPLGAPDVNGWHITGIMSLIGYIRYKSATDEKKSDSSLASAFAKLLIYPPITSGLFLFIGLIIAKLAGLA